MTWIEWSAHHKNLEVKKKEGVYYSLNQRVNPNRSEDIIVFNSHCDTTINDEHHKIISRKLLRYVIEKKTLLAEISK